MHLTAGVIGLIKPSWGVSGFRIGPVGRGVGLAVTDGGDVGIRVGAYNNMTLKRQQ